MHLKTPPSVCVPKSQIPSPSSVQRDNKKSSSTAWNQIDDGMNAFFRIR